MIHESLKHLSVPIDSLTPDPANARSHGARNLEQIAASLTAFGQRKPIVVQASGRIVRAGNGTLEAAKSLGWTEIAAVVIDEDNATASQFAIADNRTAELAEWDEQTLVSLLDGMEKDARELVGFSDAELQALLEDCAPDLGDAFGDGDGDNPYTQEVKSPVYEPKGENPPLTALADYAKRDELLAAIEEAASDLPEGVESFLRSAAERHTRFDFGNIAEFYAHAEPHIQRLMEESALVIIDFGAAIEKGFVKLNDAVHEQFDEDYPDAR